MAKAWLEDKATWLFDLAHDDLDEDAIVKGFLKHYALQGQGMGDVQRDMHFHTLWRLLPESCHGLSAESTGGADRGAAPLGDADAG